MTSARKKKPKKRIKGIRTKIIPVLAEDVSSDEEGDEEGDEEEGGMFLEKEDIQIIYNALRVYKPTEREKLLHSVLLEQFEEILVVDYGEAFTDSN